MTAHISGHVDITWAEFCNHYLERIRKAITSGHKIVVGDCRGVDEMTITFARFSSCKADLTVYHMFHAPRLDCWPFPAVGGFQSDDERDAAMTVAGDYDIAWIRPGREKSGTAKNIKRRAKLANEICKTNAA